MANLVLATRRILQPPPESGGERRSKLLSRSKGASTTQWPLLRRVRSTSGGAMMRAREESVTYSASTRGNRRSLNSRKNKKLRQQHSNSNLKQRLNSR